MRNERVPIVDAKCIVITSGESGGCVIRPKTQMFKLCFKPNTKLSKNTIYNNLLKTYVNNPNIILKMIAKFVFFFKLWPQLRKCLVEILGPK